MPETGTELLCALPVADAWLKIDVRGGLERIRLEPAGSSGRAPDAAPESGRAAAAWRSLEACCEAPCDFDAGPWLAEPCLARASSFERAAWRAVSMLPCAEAEACSALAERLGLAAGMERRLAKAVAACPLPMLIPVHRVPGAFADAPEGLQGVMRRLLELEQEKLIRWWF